MANHAAGSGGGDATGSLLRGGLSSGACVRVQCTDILTNTCTKDTPKCHAAPSEHLPGCDVVTAASAAMLPTAMGARDTTCGAVVGGFAEYTTLNSGTTSSSSSAQPNLAEMGYPLEAAEDIAALCSTAGVARPQDHPELALLVARGNVQACWTGSESGDAFGDLLAVAPACGPAVPVQRLCLAQDQLRHEPTGSEGGNVSGDLLGGGQAREGQAVARETSSRDDGGSKYSHYDEFFEKKLSEVLFPPLRVNATRPTKKVRRETFNARQVPRAVTSAETSWAADEGRCNRGRAWRAPPRPTLSEWISCATYGVW